jgi:hypothetical protein
MEKEDFIKIILESSKGIEKAEPPPFLFEKIRSRINSEAKISSNNWVFAAAASVLLVLNVFCMSTKSSGDGQVQPVSDDEGYELVQQVTYNY